MKRMMGLVCTNYPGGDFGLLTEERPVASIPFAGRYRLVDFPLSNMVNSGINTVGLITPYMYRSLLDHVGNGKAWTLSRKVGGLFILPGSTYGRRGASGKFLIRDIMNNRAYLERTQRPLVVLSASNKVFTINFRDVADAHEKAGAAVTMIYKSVSDSAGTDPSLVCDARGRVTALRKNVVGEANQFMDAMIMDRELLLKLLDWYANLNYLDLVDIIAENLDQLTVQGYAFPGYMRAIDNVVDYMAASMELLSPSVLGDLFHNGHPISTKVQDAHPSKYGPNAEVHNSMIATGCMVRGRVENSIVFRSCTIEEGAVVRNSVIMPHNVLGEGVEVENVISDKFVHLTDGVKLYGTAERPLIVTKKQYS